MKTLIVGGVAGGASCAARLRRLDEKMEIIIIEKSRYVSYANCGLPYYIGDVIKDEDDLSVQTPRSLFERFRLDVRTDSEVIKVDTDNKKVSIKNKDKVYEEMDEVKEAISENNRDHIEDELGDVFLTLVNLARYLKVRPDQALERANYKITSRFVRLCELAGEKGVPVDKDHLAELDELWNEVKRSET